MVEPVGLEACGLTSLKLLVTNDNSSMRGFRVTLLDGQGLTLYDMPVKVYVNDTLLATYMTNVYGYFVFHRNFDPANESVAYVVKCVYEGTAMLSAILNGTDFQGNNYTVCQTIYCQYKPSANMTSLVVEPQETEVTVPTKTTEEMEQEVKRNGWVTPYDEWIWVPPFYRLHYKLAMNGAIFDIGFTPLLPICGVLSTVIPHNFIPPIPITTSQEMAGQIIPALLIGTAVEVFGLAGIAVASPLTQLPGAAAIGLAIYGLGLVTLIGTAIGLYTSGSTMEAYAALMGFLINGFGAGIAGYLSWLAHETAATFANAIAFPILGAAMSNMLDPSEFIPSIVATTTIAFTAFAIEYIIVHFIPNPMNCYFEPLFIAASFIFAATTIGFLWTWAGWW